MDNILPGFRRNRHDDEEEYGRHGQGRYPTGSFGVGGPPYEYTGQPVGFEHLGSPPKQRIEDMDPKTIAQLGYEGPEGERRKAEAINEHIYEGYSHGGSRGSDYRDGYSGAYIDRRHERPLSYDRRGDYREEPGYRRQAPGRLDDYDRRTYSRDPYRSPVTVDRKVQEDGTVVESVYPDNAVVAAEAALARPDRGKIHYGRQDSFPEEALQEAAAYHHGRYPPPGYMPERSPRLPPGAYAPHYGSSTSPYGRHHSEHGSSSDYQDQRYRKY